MIDFTKLKAGDVIYYSGTLFTARDQAHKRLHEMLENNIEIPVDFKDSLIYYAGPTPTKPGDVVGSLGPTTSSRMDKYITDMESLGISGIVGKGPRDYSVKTYCKEHKLVYFVATGGAGALLSRSVEKCEEVMFLDLGCESIKRLEVKDFPLIVAYDTKGNSVFD